MVAKTIIRAAIPQQQIEKIQKPMSFLSSIPVWGWFDIGFNFVVLVALGCETDLFLKWKFPERIGDILPPESKRHQWKKRFEWLLVFGIAGEVFCLPFSIYGTADADIKAGRANERASTNEIQVGILSAKLLELAHQYDLSTNALAEANARLDQAHSEAGELEAKLKPRNISPQARTNLALQLNRVPKGNVEIIMSDRDPECMAFGLEIKKTLVAAGFPSVNFSPRDVFRAAEMFPELASSGTDLLFCVKNDSSPPLCSVLTLLCFRNDRINADGWPYNDSLGTNDFQIWVLPKPVHPNE